MDKKYPFCRLTLLFELGGGGNSSPFPHFCYIVKENHTGSMDSEILQYKQTVIQTDSQPERQTVILIYKGNSFTNVKLNRFYWFCV